MALILETSEQMIIFILFVIGPLIFSVIGTIYILSRRSHYEKAAKKDKDAAWELAKKCSDIDEFFNLYIDRPREGTPLYMIAIMWGVSASILAVWSHSLGPNWLYIGSVGVVATAIVITWCFYDELFNENTRMKEEMEDLSSEIDMLIASKR